MALLKIVTYPDPVLAKIAEPWTDFSDVQQKFFDDMIHTMYVEDGVGLAAPQVGVSKRVMIVSPKGKKGEELVIVNPEILEMHGREKGPEGCLSFPGISADVFRATKIVIRFQDRTGKTVEGQVKDFFARVIQHELDHLNGVLLVDRVDFNQRQKLLEEYRKP